MTTHKRPERPEAITYFLEMHQVDSSESGFIAGYIEQLEATIRNEQAVNEKYREAFDIKDAEIATLKALYKEFEETTDDLIEKQTNQAIQLKAGYEAMCIGWKDRAEKAEARLNNPGQTQYCLQCETYAREVELLKVELKCQQISVIHKEGLEYLEKK